MTWLLLFFVVLKPEAPLGNGHGVRVGQAVKVMATAGTLALFADMPLEESLALLWHEDRHKDRWALGKAGECGPAQVMRHKGKQKYFGNPCLFESWLVNAWVSAGKIREFKRICGRFYLNCYNGAPLRTGEYRFQVQRETNWIKKAARRVARRK